jgi:type VI secretion system protein ImpI
LRHDASWRLSRIMTLRLTIENVDRLPDGGPLRVEVKGRGLDIGRDSHLDWTLPDPSRHVSSKHCEIRFRDGDYWLHDVSTNGTFVNGAQHRLDAPHRLRAGDRIGIGNYIVAVDVEAPGGGGRAQGMAPIAAVAPAPGGDVWGAVGEVAAPDDRNAYRPKRAMPAPADFLDFASSVAPATPFTPTVSAASDDWLSALPPVPAAAPAPIPPPTPRRPATAAPAPDAPEPSPPTQPVEAPAPPVEDERAAARRLLERIATAAKLPLGAIAGRDSNALADEFGAALGAAVRNLAQLLASRAETKSLIRSSSRTMVQALENNPLKFTGSPEDALAIMFGPPSRSYLDARETIERSFADIKAHQMLTFGAMQNALEALFEDLAPEKIDSAAESDRGFSALVGSRKAKLWDIYVERWRAKTKRSDGRLNEAFMAHFAEAYDRLRDKGG